MVIISFMSTEDRKVKRAFQELARDRKARLLTKHVVTAGEAELRENAASRSAKLRALEIVDGGLKGRWAMASLATSWAGGSGNKALQAGRNRE